MSLTSSRQDECHDIPHHLGGLLLGLGATSFQFRLILALEVVAKGFTGNLRLSPKFESILFEFAKTVFQESNRLGSCGAQEVFRLPFNGLDPSYQLVLMASHRLENRAGFHVRLSHSAPLWVLGVRGCWTAR